MQRSLVALVCLLLLLSCSTATGPGPEAATWRTGTELVTTTLEPDVIDPQLSSFKNEAAIVGMLYEPLLSWSPSSLALVSAAASALPSVSLDGTLYTYHLRAGLTYSDGTPLYAARFVDAFARLCDPRVSAEYGFIAFAIVGCREWYTMDPKRSSPDELAAGRRSLGVRALDNLTVEFTLGAPDASFPQVTALWVGSPVRLEDIETFSDGWPATRLARVIGNGPFILASWTKLDRIVFERNERYRLPVRLARWTKRFVTDPDVARVWYDAGRIDAVSISPRDADDRERLLARSDLSRMLGACTTYVGFNTLAPPFDDAKVRLAFAKALDKGEYASTVLLAGRAAASLVTHATPGHAHDDRVQGFDPAEARRLLASSRYGLPKDGRLAGIEIRFPFQDTPGMKARIEWIAQQWYVNLGVQVTPTLLNSWGTLVKRPEQQPQLYRLGWCADDPDGSAWFTQFVSSSASQRTNFSDPTYDALVNAARSETDVARREALYEQASRILSAAAPGAWLHWTETWWLIDPRITGYELSSFDWDFAQFSLARIVGLKRG